MRIYTRDYSNMIECAQDAEAKSWQHSEPCTVACDTQDQMDEVVEYLLCNEDCDNDVDNNGVMEIWGTRHMQCGNAEYKVDVYVINPELNRF